MSSIYKSLPGWIAEEDEGSSKHLKYLTQIIASFFDDIYIQIQNLPRLKDINYPDDNKYESPLPFAERLLSSRGYDAPELFAHASALSKYLERDEKRLFEKKLHEVKNIIYQNIYNNLTFIQKSKGTFKSLRNFLRCFGVDEELIKLNIYSNNGVYEFKNNFSNIALRKKYLDFDDLETRYNATGLYDSSYNATAYQYYDNDDSNSLSYIPGINDLYMSGAAMTIETEVFFPKRSIIGDKNYNMFTNASSSILGMHAVEASNTNLTYDSDDTINFNIIVSKPDNDKRNVKFGLITSGTSNIITNMHTTNSYAGVYDNEKWNLAFRLKPTKYPLANFVSGSMQEKSSAYTYEFYGVNYVSNILQDEFILSGTMSLQNASKFFTKNKRIFLGAAKNNFTSSVTVIPSDVRVSSTRVWYDYLNNEVIRAHAKNANSYGVLNPYKNSNFAISNDQLFNTRIPQIDTLVLNWEMNNITGSDSNGQFSISDFTSGSATDVSQNRYGWFSDVSKRSYPGRGDFFVSTDGYTNQAVDVEYVQTAKQKLPEVVNSDDMVKILSKEDEQVFTRDTTYIQHLLSVEKSMYQVVSEEMLRFFATVVDFNNLIGQPVNRYRPYYKRMEKLRELFFERVENEPDLEKFIEYVKWIDDAVTMMIGQLIPASSNTVELLRNMVESHILERSKYWSKFPTMESKTPEPISTLHAIEELKYNWRLGHAPLTSNNSAPEQNTNQNTSCLWWKQRAERDGVLSSGDSNIDSNKAVILKTTVTEVSSAVATLTDGGVSYQESYYPNRSLRRTIDLVTNRSLKLQGGSNPHRARKHDFYKNVIKWSSDDDFIYIDMDNEIQETVCDDKTIPDEINKKRTKIIALTMPAGQITDSNAEGTGINDRLPTDGKASLLLPFTIYSSSIDTGYQGLYSDQFKIDFTNMHDDKYGFDAEVPMQGPFSEKYVGGMQHRHIEINRGTDTRLTRAEGWHIQEFLNPGSTGLDSEGLPDAEFFSNATTTPTSDINVLKMLGGSVAGDPSPYEYWINGGTADNKWTFLSGPTPTAGTGPSSGKYAYCEVLPTKVGQTFGLVTPLIDLLDISSDTSVILQFGYHMYGIHVGNLKIQASHDPDFESGVEDIEVYWGSSPGYNTALAGQQQTGAGDAFRNAYAGTTAYGAGFANWTGKRFYIRFLYTAGISHLGDCAIDTIYLYKQEAGTVKQNSFKLFNPTYDNHHRPSAIYTRQEYAKRPVSIRNIHMTGNSPTVAGNYLNRYEYVNTTSPEANDPFFVKNTSQITVTSSQTLLMHSIENMLSSVPGLAGRGAIGTNFTLPDRTYIVGSSTSEPIGAKNKTRIMSRFTSNGGFETTSRGYLDPAHETYSVYNAMTYRNISSRMIYNTELQAHCGQYGVSTHTQTGSLITARVLHSEIPGTINSLNYELSGHAAKHKYHRNNIERLELSGSSTDFLGMTVVTASSHNNGFVSHMIPRTDKQYRWITGSLI